MAHQHGAAAGHLMNESTAWSAALRWSAATAFRPRLASGVAAVLVAYSAVLAVFVITDALAAAVTATRVLSHLPVLCGAVLALLMIRTADSVGPDPRSHADGGDADDDEADDRGGDRAAGQGNAGTSTTPASNRRLGGLITTSRRT